MRVIIYLCKKIGKGEARMENEEFFEIALKIIREKISYLEFSGIDKEDVVQESMLKILGAIKHYDSSKSSPATFISRVIDNKIKDLFKAASTQKNKMNYKAVHIEASLETDNYEGENLDFQLPSAERGFEDVIFIESLYKIKWTNKEKEVIDYLLNGYQKKEIAQKMRVTSASISQTCNKIKNKLITERMV